MGKQIVVVDYYNNKIYTDYEFPSAEELKSMYGRDTGKAIYKFFRDTECITIQNGVVQYGSYAKVQNDGSRRDDLTVGGVLLYSKPWTGAEDFDYTFYSHYVKPFTGSVYDI